MEVEVEAEMVGKLGRTVSPEFDGSSIDGFSRVQESDVLAKPDPKTFQILPFRIGREGDTSPVARVFCDITNLDDTPFEGCPRHVLRRTLERARARGFSFYAAPEIEYFYFAPGEPGEPPKPLDSGSYFELTVADLTTDLRKRTVLTLEDMGIPVEYAQHEDAPSQHEIDLRYTDALDHGRHGDDGPPHCEGDRARERRSRELHAQTTLGCPGLGHAHTLLVVRG